jgi:hypothetical protein
MLSAKESGYILSIDQASNCAGCSLWKDSIPIAWTDLKSASPKDAFGRRLVKQVEDLNKFLDEHLPEGETIKTVLFEGVKSSIVLSTVGAFCCSPYLQDCRFHPRHSFISALSWKKYVRDYGKTQQRFKEIKGVQALKDIDWDFETYPIESDDVADSVLIYKCWAVRKEKK